MIVMPLQQRRKRANLTDYAVAYSPANGSPLAWETAACLEAGVPRSSKAKPGNPCPDQAPP
jgi:hypothetical protein